MKIFAIEKNYAPNNKKAGCALYKPSAPVVFLKADSALLKNGKPFFIPDWSGEVTFGAALAIRICRLGKSVPERFAHRYYDAVTVGVDFTARDLQRKLRSEGLPWDLSKSFDGSAVIGDWVDAGTFGDIQALHFRLCVNGATAQEGNAGEMLFKVDEAIAYISNFFTLKTGDILFTGTVSDDGAPRIGDHMTGYVEDRKVLEFNCK